MLPKQLSLEETCGKCFPSNRCFLKHLLLPLKLRGPLWGPQKEEEGAQKKPKETEKPTNRSRNQIT